jgi:hypothetical protein
MRFFFRRYLALAEDTFEFPTLITKSESNERAFENFSHLAPISSFRNDQGFVPHQSAGEL